MTFANLAKCNRTPEGHGAVKTPADGRFHIRISENTAKYTPGKTYTSNKLFTCMFSLLFSYLVFHYFYSNFRGHRFRNKTNAGSTSS